MLNSLRLKSEELYKVTNDDKFLFISKLLITDDCFFRLDMDTALSILTDLEVDNPIETYKELIKPENFVETNRVYRIKG